MSKLVPTHYPPIIENVFSGVPKAPPGRRDQHFNDFRNERMARLLFLPGPWDGLDIEYTPSNESVGLGKSKQFDKFLKLPPSKFSMLDVGRQNEIDNFYEACQKHRDQYKDETNNLHPLEYFKNKNLTRREIIFDCTSKYLNEPIRYVRYKDPQVWPLTLGRQYNFPLIPYRTLVGDFNPFSDFRFKN